MQYLVHVKVGTIARRRRQGGGMVPLKFYHTVILCFEKQRPKQKYCCMPKVKHFGPNFWSS